MITILRRIRTAARGVTASDWLLVGVETVLLIVGILVAFQLQEWATDRREAAQVESLLEQLVREMKSTVIALDGHLADTGAMLTVARPRAAALAAGRCPADMGNLEGVDIWRTGFNPPMSAYTELVNAVGLSALPSAPTKEAVTAYAYQLGYLDRDEDESRANMGPLFGPDDARVRRSVRATPVDPYRTTFTDWDQIRREDRRLRSYDRAALCADAAFRQRYVEAVRHLERATLIRADTLAVLADACNTLAAHLGQACIDDPGVARAIGGDRVAKLRALVARYNAS